jgi:ATP citrate (pro-S)-lyase
VNSGLQPRAVQGMLDFDFICKRKQPSVAGIIYTFGGQFVSKMFVPGSNNPPPAPD